MTVIDHLRHCKTLWTFLNCAPVMCQQRIEEKWISILHKLQRSYPHTTKFECCTLTLTLIMTVHRHSGHSVALQLNSCQRRRINLLEANLSSLQRGCLSVTGTMEVYYWLWKTMSIKNTFFTVVLKDATWKWKQCIKTIITDGDLQHYSLGCSLHIYYIPDSW